MTKIQKELLKTRDEPISSLMNKFLGIGVCKECGRVSTDTYCHRCTEIASELGINLYRLGSVEYYIIRNGKRISKTFMQEVQNNRGFKIRENQG